MLKTAGNAENYNFTAKEVRSVITKWIETHYPYHTYSINLPNNFLPYTANQFWNRGIVRFALNVGMSYALKNNQNSDWSSLFFHLNTFSWVFVV